MLDAIITAAPCDKAQAQNIDINTAVIVHIWMSPTAQIKHIPTSSGSRPSKEQHLACLKLLWVNRSTVCTWHTLLLFGGWGRRTRGEKLLLLSQFSPHPSNDLSPDSRLMKVGWSWAVATRYSSLISSEIATVPTALLHTNSLTYLRLLLSPVTFFKFQIQTDYIPNKTLEVLPTHWVALIIFLE